MFKIIENSIIKWIGIDRYLSMQIDITNFCNLACSHCYHPHHNNKNAISLASWIEIIDEYEIILQRLNAKAHIIICGGEPLTSQYLKPLLLNLLNRERTFHLSILTNGTLVDRIDLSILKKFPHVEFQVSIDGPTAELHDSFRGKGNFEKALEGIHLLKKNNFTVGLQATLTKKNSQSISQFFDLSKLIKSDFMSFTRLITIGSGKNLVEKNIDQTLKPKELKKAFEMILFHSARTNIRSSTESPLMNLLHPILGRKQRFQESIVIDYQGNLLVSSRSREILGNVLGKNLENLFFNHPLREKFKSGKIEECSNCPHFKYCGGDRNVSFAEYGDFFKKDPGCWINIDTVGA
jgi:radical SAM protein with 4Fe4S-binding SPASM domain